VKVNLYYTTKNLQSELLWELGESVYLGTEVLEGINAINGLARKIFSEYFIFIDLDKYEIPNQNVVLDILNNRPGEIWHIGNKIEDFRNKPLLYNYFQPTSIYNLTSDDTIDVTSWKLSGDCFLVKTDIIFQMDLKLYPYSNLHAWGLDLGYRCYRNGMIIRYCADLSQLKSAPINCLSLSEEAIFIKRNIGKKWLSWCLIRHFFKTRTLLKCINAFLHVKDIKFGIDNEIKRDLQIESNLISHPRVAVFAPTLYRYSYLEEELKQLREQTIKPYQIVITDQTNETDRDNSWLKNYTDLPILYKAQNEKGQCNAWNFCLMNTDADYVLFLGDDADEIYPAFIEDLYRTMIDFKADVVGCNIKEGKFNYPYKQESVFITETFPICLVKRDVFVKSGGYDYAYNKGIRADADVAIRIVLNGGLMVLNPNVKLHHHRAPVGGLRHHKQRKITNSVSRNSIWKFQLPAFTEIYLHRKYFSKDQQKGALVIKLFSLFSINGGLVKKSMNAISLIIQSPILIYRYKKITAAAKELAKEFPQIQEIK